MVDRVPRLPQDWRNDAVNALRLAAMVRDDHLKVLLLRAANEFLRKAGELEATLVVVAPSEAVGEIGAAQSSHPDAAG